MKPIILPWPTNASGVTQNSRPGNHFARAKAIKRAVNEGWIEALAAGWRKSKVPAEGAIPLRITFHPPHGKYPDRDGCLSRCKSHLDGIAAALGVDDARFTFTLVYGAQERPATVTVEYDP